MIDNRGSSKVPAEWGRDPFIFVRQSACKDLATDEALPLWLRAVQFAYANATANGHATLKPRALAAALGSTVEGQWIEATSQQTTNAVTRAVEKGLLDPASGALCLVVPRSAVAGGLGDPTAPCRRRHKVNRTRPALRVVTDEAV